MLLHILYLIGITAEAMTGALAAGRRRMDTFGVIIIATATAIGGGSVRDILLGHYPLGWVKHPEYVIIVATAAGSDHHCGTGDALPAQTLSGVRRFRAGRLFNNWRPGRAGYGARPHNCRRCCRDNGRFRRRITRYVLQTHSACLSERIVRWRLLRLRRALHYLAALCLQP